MDTGGFQKREQVPKCGSNEEGGKNSIDSRGDKSDLQETVRSFPVCDPMNTGLTCNLFQFSLLKYFDETSFSLLRIFIFHVLCIVPILVYVAPKRPR
jgi:hypothetical protein